MSSTPPALPVTPSPAIKAASGGISLAGLGTLAAALQHYLASPTSAGGSTAVLAAVGALLTAAGFGAYLTHARTLLRAAEPGTVAALRDARTALADVNRAVTAVDPGLEAQVRAWTVDELAAHPAVVDEERIAAKTIEALQARLGLPPVAVTPGAVA